MCIKCKFSDVSEHDMDLLFLEEFVVSEEFLKIFTSRIGISDAIVVEVEQSKTDPLLGESDMTVIIEANGNRHGLLIEDKIDAIAMPEQYHRYVKRGEMGITNGEYASFDVFIVAPEKYLCKNTEAQKYPHQISYEECEKYFEKDTDQRKIFKLSQIRDAIHKQKTGYQVIEHKAVTEFWGKYIAYQKENYQHLFLTATEGPRGAKALWPRFNTVIKELYILHKSEAGFIDLTISNASDKLYPLEKMLDEIVDLKAFGISIHPTGKAAALRILVPKLDFMKPFEQQENDVETCFQAVEKLAEFVKKFDAEKIRLLMNHP